jgi:hypothetical protein
METLHMNEPRDIRCFVIMPFSETSTEHTETHWSTLFSTFLKPLIEENPRVEAFRSTARREDLLSEILKNLVTNPIVVADLTDHNPNVFWELGVRQSFSHGTITIAEQGTHLPFDLGKKGTLFYHTKDMLKNEPFRRGFKEAILDCINSPQRPDSIVLETIGGRGSLFEIIRREEVSRRLTALNSELEANLHLLERTLTHAKNNEDRRKQKEKGESPSGALQIVAGRFRFSCVELLVSNRYLDAPSELYSSAEAYYNQLFKLNDQLRIWETEQQTTESYFISNADYFKKDFQQFTNALSKQK